ncbi:MAG TPA: ABC transporter permease [Anaeromyxobacter sp.]|nr:ABC transporter permease [Anaeromyxobacter sp.]
MTGPEPARSRLLRIEGLPILAVLAILVGAFMVAAPDVFLGYRIYMSFLTTVPPLLVLAVGLTLVIAAGEIDLSFPSVIALAGWILAYFTHVLGSSWLGLLLALVAGAVVGYLNGLVVARLGIPSIIATLATQFLWGGLTTVFSQGLSYSMGEAEDLLLWKLLVGRIGPFPVQALWALAIAVALWLVLNRHRFGEHLLFIGDNARVAEVVGVNVARERIRAFVLMGVMAAVASALLTLENKSFFNTQGSGYLLEVMAAVFIGGTSVFGGRASVVGSVAGSFIIGMVEAGLVATGLQGFWVRAVVGAVFLAAVIGHLLIEEPERGHALVRALRARLEAPGRRRSPGRRFAGTPGGTPAGGRDEEQQR